MKRQVVFFDLETTGTDVAHDEIIQIAAVAVDDDLNETETFEAKLLPSATGEIKLEELITSGFPTVYDREVWAAKSVSLHRGLSSFALWLKKFPAIRQVSKKGYIFWTAQLVGHNAARFDGEFLFRAAKELGVFMPASYMILDTLQLALWAKMLRSFNPPAYNLGALTKHFEVPLLNAHNAIDDVRATVEVAKKLIEIVG